MGVSGKVNNIWQLSTLNQTGIVSQSKYMLSFANLVPKELKLVQNCQTVEQRPWYWSGNYWQLVKWKKIVNLKFGGTSQNYKNQEKCSEI